MLQSVEEISNSQLLEKLLAWVAKCISNARIIQIMCSIGVKICTTSTRRRGGQSLWNDNLILHFHGWKLGHELAGNVLD